MTQMSMGSNVALTATTVRASLRWSAGPGIPEVDASALLLNDTGNVGADTDFIFYNQPEHPSGAVRMGGKTPAPQASDQVDIDLTRLPAAVSRIVLAASSDGGVFGQVPQLEMVLLDLATGQVIASFPMRAGDETAFVSAEIYRRNDAWKFRAVGQGYASGLAGLAADFGIDAGGAPAAASPPAAAPPPSAPPLAATPPPSAPPPTPAPPAPPPPTAAPVPPPPATPAAPPAAEREPGYDPLLDLS